MLYSTNNKYLHKDLKRALRILHTHYSAKNKRILFPNVQQQTNSKDNGDFTILFDVSLFET